MSAAAVAPASPRAPRRATASTWADGSGGDLLPSGAFFAEIAPHGEARAGRVAWQSARVQRSPALSTLRKGRMKTGRRRRSRKKRMEAAVAGFKPSIPDEFQFEPVNFDPQGMSTPLVKR